MSAAKPVNYWEYIRVEELLRLQQGLEEEGRQPGNDEVLFITVHQIFELWFQLVLRELRSLRDFFKADAVEDQAMSNAARSLRRTVTLFRRCADHFEVMETLTTREYLGFRDKLMPASGFQSAQLRQIEVLLGLDAGSRLPLGSSENFMDALRAHDGSESTAYRRVQAQLEDRPSLLDAIEAWLFRTPIDGVAHDQPGAQAALERFVASYLDAHGVEVDRSCEIALERAQSDEDRDSLRDRYADEKDAMRAFLHPGESDGGARRQRIRAAILFIVTYRELPLLAWPREVLDGLIELEQGMLIFRQRHARMVERVIGRRIGTGGSSGVDYLDATALRYRVFKDLWSVRTFQLRSAASPALENAGFYEFRNA